MSLLAAGLSSIGCSGRTDGSATPTWPSAQQHAGSGENVSRPPQPPRPDPPPATGTCVADRANWALGQPASASLLDRARIDATASIARFIRPNEAITLEYSAARLNLYLDERDIVRGVVCG
jgi:hypothetical protein